MISPNQTSQMVFRRMVLSEQAALSPFNCLKSPNLVSLLHRRYLRIHLENVPQSKQHNFRKETTQNANSYGIPYDYGSVMHYDRYVSKNNGYVRHPVLGPYYYSTAASCIMVDTRVK